MTIVVNEAMRKAVRLIRDNNRGMTNVYIAPAARARWAIVASIGSRKARVGATSDDTLWKLRQLRCVKVESLKSQLGDYRDRRRGDAVYGWRITVTDAGRSLIS